MRELIRFIRRTVVAIATRRDWQAVQQVDARAPPTLLLHGLADKRVYVTHTQQLHDALAAQGAHVEMELYAGASHADTVQGFSAFRRRRAPTRERVLLFLQQRIPIDQSANTSLHIGSTGKSASSGILETRLDRYKTQLADWCNCPRDLGELC